MTGVRTVVIGGSYIGCLTAQSLARQGALSPEQLFHLTVYHAESPEHIDAMLNHSDRAVTIVERRSKIGFGFEPGTAGPVWGIWPGWAWRSSPAPRSLPSPPRV